VHSDDCGRVIQCIITDLHDLLRDSSLLAVIDATA
jgi:hypothetical protein